MKFNNWIKSNKTATAIILILLSLTIYLSLNSRNNGDNYITIQDNPKVGELNKAVKLGDLSFKLIDLNLYKEEIVYSTFLDARSYHLILSLNVTNNGERIENLSYYCGELLFDGGTQYNFDVTKGGLLRNDVEQGNLEFRRPPQEYDLTGICAYKEIVPGATITIYDEFYFSDTYYSDLSINWEQIPDSKITYFLQENNGLLKFIIDKKDVSLNGAPDIFRVTPNQ